MTTQDQDQRYPWTEHDEHFLELSREAVEKSAAFWGPEAPDTVMDRAYLEAMEEEKKRRSQQS